MIPLTKPPGLLIRFQRLPKPKLLPKTSPHITIRLIIPRVVKCTLYVETNGLVVVGLGVMVFGEEETFLYLLGGRDRGQGEMLGVVVGGLGAGGEFLEHWVGGGG